MVSYTEPKAALAFICQRMCGIEKLYSGCNKEKCNRMVPNVKAAVMLMDS